MAKKAMPKGKSMAARFEKADEKQDAALMKKIAAKPAKGKKGKR